LIAELGAAFVLAEMELDKEPRIDHACYLSSRLTVLKTMLQQFLRLPQMPVWLNVTFWVRRDTLSFELLKKTTGFS